MRKFFKKYKYEIILAIFVCVYILYFTTASFLRYDNFYTGRFDLGNMDQAVWNSIHGRIFQITDPNGTDIISRLAFHADFILILISPLYLIWSNPKTLLLLQSMVLGLGSVFIYLIAKKILKSKSLALILGIIFLFNPAVNYANLYDFHPVTLGTTLLLVTFYYFLKRRYFLFLIFAILAGLTKEHVWTIVSLFGAGIILRALKDNGFKYKALNKKQIKEIAFGMFIFLASAALFYLLIWKIIPAARGSSHFAVSYYSDFGNSASSATLNILLSPLKILRTIFQEKQIYYIFQMLLPLGFLSLFSPLILIFSGPDFAINLLSNNNQLHEIYYQYTSTITPFLFIAAIYALSFLKKRLPLIPNKTFITYLILATAVSAYSFGPLPFSKTPNINMFTKQLTNKDTIENFIESIPTKYSIAATNNIGSHLSRRQKIYTIPVGIDKADVILFLLNDPFAQPSLQTQKLLAEQMRNDRNYVQVYKDKDFIAFEKRTLYTEPKPKPKRGQIKLFPYSITALSDRSYKASQIKIEKQVPASGNFKSFVISFTSDGLKEYALMNIPNFQKPEKGFPVLILNHGYIRPNSYDTVNSYKTDSDYFANQGFLVLKPDYRGNGKSEVEDRALMRFAYAIDVLNLIASVENIPEADKNQIFLWSHSMGGEVALEVLEVASKNDDFSAKIKGAVFWAPVTDPLKWFSKQNLPNLPESRQSPFPYTETFQILGTPDENPEIWQSLSPLNYLSNINVPILLQHGTADTTVPYEWSAELYSKLQELNKDVDFISYPNDSHNLPLHWQEAVLADSKFFKSLQNQL